MATIHIRDLEVFAHHGVFPEEKALGQKFILSADLEIDISQAAAADALKASVHYGEVAKTMTAFLQENTFDLIETAAYRLCREVLQRYPKVAGLTLTLDKPWAPIGLPLKSVGVTCQLAWTPVLISMGSNLGDREQLLHQAKEGLVQSPDVRLQKVSSYYETAPVGPEGQGDYLNACLLGETLLSPQALLRHLQDIEHAAGRTREVRWGPRTLDLDLLYYGDLISSDPDLTLPHPRLQDRTFVLEPATEIAPNFMDPRYQKPVALLYQELLDRLQEAQA